jgi:hypothetical protein
MQAYELSNKNEEQDDDASRIEYLRQPFSINRTYRM